MLFAAMRTLTCLLILLATLSMAVPLSAAPAPLEPIPEKLVVLTFDDSSLSHFTVARPILLRYGFGATFFITEGYTFPINKVQYMTWEQIAQLHQDGFEIGNHTRDHMPVNARTLDRMTAQIEAINQRCEQFGIPRPVSFAYPGNSFLLEALPLLSELGIQFARRGGAPEFPYAAGQGSAYEPGADHPLLIPAAGDARPAWGLEDFQRAVLQARAGRIAVLQFHGVPEGEHPWVSTPPGLFEQYMEYLYRNDYRVIALRDLARYVDPNQTPQNPMAIIEQRQAAAPALTRVRGRVRDAQTGAALPSRIYIRDEEGQWHFPDVAAPGGSAIPYQRQNWVNPRAIEQHSTVSADLFELLLPPGRYTFTIERGKEYTPETRAVTVEDQPLDLDFSLRRWIDMARLGWFSGDTHVHRSLDDLPNVMLAEDVNVTFPLTFWVTNAFVSPSAAVTDPAAIPPASPIVAGPAHAIYPRNTEYEISRVNNRSHQLGAVFVLNHRSIPDLGAPPMKPIAARARSEGALLELDKHDWPWSMMLVPVMGVDLYELSNNHVWRTEFAFTNWNAPAPAYMKLPGGRRSGDEMAWLQFTWENYYALLNCGFRLRPTAGTANGVHPVPLGFSRVYVRTGGRFDAESWLRGLNAGKSFVTTGPMLLVTVNQQDPGFTFQQQPRQTRYRLGVRAVSDQPIDRVELIYNGRVVRTNTPTDATALSGRYEVGFTNDFNVVESSWVAVRCFSVQPDGRIRFAHTAPFHFEVAGRPLVPRREQAEYLIERVQEQLARNRTVLPQEALEEYQQALEAYQKIARTAK
jgi:peptidoglycan/xylan/chitin deacetylase (PgdA/CDA1 family)